MSILPEPPVCSRSRFPVNKGVDPFELFGGSEYRVMKLLDGGVDARFIAGFRSFGQRRQQEDRVGVAGAEDEVLASGAARDSLPVGEIPF